MKRHLKIVPILFLYAELLLVQTMGCLKEPPSITATTVERSTANHPGLRQNTKGIGTGEVPTSKGQSLKAQSPSESTEIALPGSEEIPPVRADGTVFAESELMGTRVSINVWLDQQAQASQAGKAIREAFYEIARIEKIASEWQDNSEVSQINQNSGSGHYVKVSPELVQILESSKIVSSATNGLFDVSFYGVGRLWKFKPGSTPPSKANIRAKLRLVNWREIDIADDRSGVRLQRKGMAIGLGAIAKGFAVDAASRILNDRGFRNHIVEGGGDTYVSGAKGGKLWMVGVQDPGHRGVIGVLPTKDRAIVTSGNYERFFEYEGKKYTHILDPRTGEPLPEGSSPQSVTIVAANASLADAYCTGVIVMGHEVGLRFVESRADLEAVIVDHDGEVSISSGLKDIFQAREKKMPTRWP